MGTRLTPIKRENRPAKFGIDYRDAEGKRKRIFFKTAAERNRRMKEMADAVEQNGLSVLSVNAADIQLLADLRRILPENVDPREAARFYVREHGSMVEQSLSTAIQEYSSALQNGGRSYDYIQHAQVALRSLCATFEMNTGCHEVSTGDCGRFLAELDFAPVTVSNYHQYIASFFKWCQRAGYIRNSPMDAVPVPSVPESEPMIYKVADVEKLFAAAVELPHMPQRLALSFFGGLRSSSVLRLDRKDLDFESRTITFPGDKHKTKRRFVVQHYPENLWAWLEPWRELREIPRIPSSTFIKHREQIRQTAGVPAIHNGGRHSFCSYHIAMHGSAAQAATLLTHRGSVTILYNHYMGTATKADAERYFNIRPEGLD